MLLAAVLATVLASASPSPSTAASPAPRPLGLLVDRSNHPITQPSFDRWIHATADRFAQQFSVAVVALPLDPGATNPDPCGVSHLAGFVEPSRHWHLSKSEVSVTAYLIVFDCAGDRFFEGESEQTVARNRAMVPQQQIDSEASRASADLMTQFATFESGHRVLWARLLATGSINGP